MNVFKKINVSLIHYYMSRNNMPYSSIGVNRRIFRSKFQVRFEKSGKQIEMESKKSCKHRLRYSERLLYKEKK